MGELVRRFCFLLMAVILPLNGCGGDTSALPESSVSTETYSSVVADAGADQNVLTGSAAILNGSGSSNSGFYPLTYTWSFVYLPAGSTATLSNIHSPTPSFHADIEGIYMLKLVVSDGRTDSSPDMVTIHAQR